MASLHHDQLRQELAKAMHAHPNESEQLLARSALMWLCVAQRPLQAHELWVALQVEESMDIEHIERLLTEPDYVNEAKATTSLQSLLSNLISIREDSHGQTHVALCDPELRTLLTHLDLEDDMAAFAFSTRQAHVVAASVCMVICSVSTLHLAHVHDETIASSLVLYSWSSWSNHLSLSGYQLSNENAANLFDSMVFRVCTDVLVFLLALNDFVTGPVTVPATENRLDCVAMVQKAQRSLEGPTTLLCALVSKYDFSKTLQSARKAFEESKYSSAPPNATYQYALNATSGASDGEGAASVDDALSSLANSPIFTRPTSSISKVGFLRIDKLLTESESVLGAVERRAVRALAETARGLRAVCIAVAGSPLYEALVNEYEEEWSPLDVLVNTANWMEEVSGYPYWQELPSGNPPDVFNISDTTDDNYETALLIGSRVRKIGPGSAKDGLPQPPSRSMVSRKRPSDISATHWQGAVMLEKLTLLKNKPGPGSNFTINDLRVLSQRTSSFARVPPQSHSSDDFLYRLTSLAPNSLRRFYRKAVSPILARIFSSGIFKALDDFGSGAFTGGATSLWSKVKTAILFNGYRSAIAYFAIAILLHHVRRILMPWLSAWLYHAPIEDLRLALSNPDVFLDDSLSVSWVWIFFMICQKYVCDLLGGLSIGLLALDNGRLPPNTIAQLQQSPINLVQFFERVMDATKIGYIAWALASAEYIVDRSANTVAFFIAFGKLLFGGDAEHIALGRVMKAHWLKLPVIGYQLYFYATSAMWPILWGSVVCAVVGQPGLLLVMLSVVGGLFGLLRYRSRLIIALELSGLFIVMGFAVVVLALMAVEFVDDPLSLKTSTASARRVAGRARAALPKGSATRTQILRRRAAMPVSMPFVGGEVEDAPQTSPSAPMTASVEEAKDKAE